MLNQWICLRAMAMPLPISTARNCRAGRTSREASAAASPSRVLLALDSLAPTSRATNHCRSVPTTIASCVRTCWQQQRTEFAQRTETHPREEVHEVASPSKRRIHDGELRSPGARRWHWRRARSNAQVPLDAPRMSRTAARDVSVTVAVRSYFVLGDLVAGCVWEEQCVHRRRRVRRVQCDGATQAHWGRRRLDRWQWINAHRHRLDAPQCRTLWWSERAWCRWGRRLRVRRDRNAFLETTSHLFRRAHLRLELRHSRTESNAFLC